MSTHRFTLRRYKHTCVPFFLACCGLFLALQVLLASAVFASSSRALAFTAVVPSADQEGFARARVSAVRLLTTFKAPDTGKTVATCTGLGVLIASNDGDVGKQTSSMLWVLTDSSLVSGQCSANQTNKTLASAQMYFNTAYTSDAQQGSGLLTNDSSMPPICADENKCEPNQAAFLSFQGKASPFLALASSLPSQTSKYALVLKQKETSNVKFPDPANESQVKEYLIPERLSENTTNLEPGTPFIDDDGHLIGIRSKNGKIIETGPIQTLIGLGHDGLDALPANPSNQVNTHWNAGIDAFYNQPPDYRTASAEFQQAEQLNTAFKGGQAFISEANHGLSGTLTPTQTSQSPGDGTDTSSSFPLWLVSILLLVVLIIIVVVGGLVFRSKIRKRQQFLAQLIQLESIAGFDARRIRQVATGGNQQIFCLNCDASVPAIARFCPNCNYQLLSPSTSSTNKQLVLRPQVGTSAQVQFDPADIRAALNTDQLMASGAGQKSQNHPPDIQKQL